MFKKISLSSLGKPAILTALAMGLVSGAIRANANDYIDDPKPGQVENGPYRQIPLRSDNVPAQQAAATGRLAIEQVGEALDANYPGKNTISNNGETYYTVNIQRGTWKFHLVVSLSPNGNVLWINAPLLKIDDSANVSTSAMVALLKKNAELGPIFFQINGNGMLEITEPISNHDLSPQRVQGEIENFLAAIRTTQPLWNKDVIAPAAATSVAPAESHAAPSRNPLARNPQPRNPLAD